MKYLQGKAGRYVNGDRATSNPTMASRFILSKFGQPSGGRKILRAYRRIRRSAYKGNPAIAALAGALGGLGGISKRFRARAEKRAAPLATNIVALANAGNLVAARGLIERAAHPMNAAEKQIWAAAAAQLSPKIRKSVTQYAELIPAADQSSPEAFVASIQLAPPVSLSQIEEEAREERATRGAAAERRAAREEAAAERRETRLTEAGAAIGSAILGRGRRPSTRRRRRRTPRLY